MRWATETMRSIAKASLAVVLTATTSITTTAQTGPTPAPSSPAPQPGPAAGDRALAGADAESPGHRALRSRVGSAPRAPPRCDPRSAGRRCAALMAQTIRDQDADGRSRTSWRASARLPGAPLADEWQALEQALRLGGVRRDGPTCCRSSSAIAPRVEGRDERLFVAGRGVAVRAEPDRRRPWSTRVSHALVQEALGVPTRAGAAGVGVPGLDARLGPERRLAWVCTTATPAGQRPLLRVRARRRRVKADADLLAPRRSTAHRARTERVVHVREVCRLLSIDRDSPSAGHRGGALCAHRVDMDSRPPRLSKRSEVVTLVPSCSRRSCSPARCARSPVRRRTPWSNGPGSSSRRSSGRRRRDRPAPPRSCTRWCTSPSTTRSSRSKAGRGRSRRRSPQHRTPTCEPRWRRRPT